jgi:hypothetical protein
MSKPSTTVTARNAASLGSNMTPAALESYFHRLGGIRVRCKHCKKVMPGTRFNLHLVKEHNLTDPVYHRKIHTGLQRLLREKQNQRRKFNSPHSKEARRKRFTPAFLQSEGLYPSPSRMLMDQKNTYARPVEGGAIEMNRRKH